MGGAVVGSGEWCRAEWRMGGDAEVGRSRRPFCSSGQPVGELGGLEGVAGVDGAPDGVGVGVGVGAAPARTARSIAAFILFTAAW